jgi:hypothetical protein
MSKGMLLLGDLESDAILSLQTLLNFIEQKNNSTRESKYFLRFMQDGLKDFVAVSRAI